MLEHIVVLLRTHSQQHSALLSFLKRRRSLPGLLAGRYTETLVVDLGSLLRAALTNIIRIEILAEISKTGPRKNEEVELRKKSAFFRASIQCIPDNALELLDKGLRFH